MEIDEIKKKMMEWGIIKNNKQLQLYYDVKPMKMKDKINRYGELFAEDFAKLIKLREEKEIMKFIKKERSKLNQIIIADTYFAMIKGYQLLTKDCSHRLIDTCTLKDQECSLLICPILKDLIKKGEIENEN